MEKGENTTPLPPVVILKIFCLGGGGISGTLGGVFIGFICGETFMPFEKFVCTAPLLYKKIIIVYSPGVYDIRYILMKGYIVFSIENFYLKEVFIHGKLHSYYC